MILECRRQRQENLKLEIILSLKIKILLIEINRAPCIPGVDIGTVHLPSTLVSAETLK